MGITEEPRIVYPFGRHVVTCCTYYQYGQYGPTYRFCAHCNRQEELVEEKPKRQRFTYQGLYKNKKGWLEGRVK